MVPASYWILLSVVDKFWEIFSGLVCWMGAALFKQEHFSAQVGNNVLKILHFVSKMGILLLLDFVLLFKLVVFGLVKVFPITLG